MVTRDKPGKKETPCLTLPLDDAVCLIKKRIEVGLSLSETQVGTWESLRTLTSDIDKWNKYNMTLLEKLFTTDSLVHEYNFTGAASIGNIYGARDLTVELNRIKAKIKQRITRLESIIDRLPLLDVVKTPSEQTNEELESKINNVTGNNKVFIVHGHDQSVKLDVARSLEKLGLEPIILHEQPSLGQTIIEKLERNSDVGFAIILLTPDDVGKGNSDNTLKPRARQNVLIELGYFIAKLGRNKVCPLYVEGVELPSDLSGVLFIPVDNAGAWRFELCKELLAAGYKVSADKLLN